MKFWDELAALLDEHSVPGDALVTVTTSNPRLPWRQPVVKMIGCVWLEPGVGLHVVDVTAPDAPCIIMSPKHPQRDRLVR